MDADGRPRPKVIDFGVAKAIGQKLTEQSLAATTMIVGTPAYMSPEQADPASMDIDIRTDVYALGVILYELLAGTPPHDVDSVPRGDVLEVLRRIRDVDSPRPSTKVKSSVSLSKIAANRSIDPQKLGPMLRGELDWIALKAIERDRNRRYATVSGLQQDIERYLAGEMVEARPPSRSYRLQKFVRRNRWQVAAASLLAVSLIAGIFGTSWGMLKKQNYIEAEPFLTSAYEGMTKLPEGAPKNVDERRNVVVGFLVDLATSTNRPDDVAKWELLRVTVLETNPRNLRHSQHRFIFPALYFSRTLVLFKFCRKFLA